MKTLQEIKDEIARKHHWKSWEEMRNTGIDEGMFELFQNEAAELYASQRVAEVLEKDTDYQELLATNKQLVEALEKLKSDIETKMSTLLSPERYQGMRIALDMLIEATNAQPNPKE